MTMRIQKTMRLMIVEGWALTPAPFEKGDDARRLPPICRSGRGSRSFSRSFRRIQLTTKPTIIMTSMTRMFEEDL